MIYLLNAQSEVVSKVNEAPTDGANYAIINQELDLDNYTYVVGSMDDDHNVTWLNPSKPKPAEQLIANIKALNQTNDTLGQQVADLTLQNIQLNTTMDTLGAMVAQSQIDIMTLKGGTV